MKCSNIALTNCIPKILYFNLTLFVVLQILNKISAFCNIECHLHLLNFEHKHKILQRYLKIFYFFTLFLTLTLLRFFFISHFQIGFFERVNNIFTYFSTMDLTFSFFIHILFLAQCQFIVYSPENN